MCKRKSRLVNFQSKRLSAIEDGKKRIHLKENFSFDFSNNNNKRHLFFEKINSILFNYLHPPFVHIENFLLFSYKIANKNFSFYCEQNI